MNTNRTRVIIGTAIVVVGLTLMLNSRTPAPPPASPGINPQTGFVPGGDLVSGNVSVADPAESARRGKDKSAAEVRALFADAEAQVDKAKAALAAAADDNRQLAQEVVNNRLEILAIRRDQLQKIEAVEPKLKQK